MVFLNFKHLWMPIGCRLALVVLLRMRLSGELTVGFLTLHAHRAYRPPAPWLLHPTTFPLFPCCHCPMFSLLGQAQQFSAKIKRGPAAHSLSSPHRSEQWLARCSSFSGLCHEARKTTHSSGQCWYHRAPRHGRRGVWTDACPSHMNMLKLLPCPIRRVPLL